jgi:hypothetical protein
MVGAFSGAPAGDQVSLRLSAAGAVEGSTSYNYAWATASAPVYRTGPGSNRINHINQSDLDAIHQDDAIFRGDAPDEQNQSVFVRGHKIMLAYTLMASGGIQSDAETLPIVDTRPEDVSTTASNVIPFAGSSNSTLITGWSGGVGSGGGQGRVWSLEDSGRDETLHNILDHKVVLESIPGCSEVSIYMILS